MYIGSSNNISVRMYKYFDLHYLAKSNRVIDRAMLKYGFPNFTLDILEYCDISKLIDREQYYMDILKPEYNIVSKAGSTLGYKHTSEAIEKMRSFILSEEVLNKKRMSTVNATNSRKVIIMVENIVNNDKNIYNSMTDAGKVLGVSKTAVSQSLKNNTLIKKKYRVTNIKIKKKNCIVC